MQDKGLLAAFAERACVIVTDDFPCFFLPRMIAAVAPRLSVKLEQVDSNGMLAAAHARPRLRLRHFICAFLQKELPTHLQQPPLADPIAGVKLPRCGRCLRTSRDAGPARVGQAAGRRSRATRGFTDRSFGWYCPRSRRSDCCSQTAAAISPRIIWGNARTSPTNRTRMLAAACPRICTSDTFHPTNCFRPGPSPNDGPRGDWGRKRGAGEKGGGVLTPRLGGAGWTSSSPRAIGLQHVGSSR